MVNDYEVLMLINEGEEELISILLKKYLPIIKGTINKYNKVLLEKGINREEVYSEVIKSFINAINNYSEYKSAKFKTYVSVVMHNCVKRIISSKNRGINDNNLDLSIEYLAVDNKSNPLLKIEESERIDELMKYAKNNLSKMEYKVFLLKINNISYEGISKILNTNIGNVYDAIYRIRCKIRKKLEENA